jgi:hypothetical protein
MYFHVEMVTAQLAVYYCVTFYERNLHLFFFLLKNESLLTSESLFMHI